MLEIVKIKFGSHLYGTNTPTSDIDIKGVYLPTARDILLQRVQPVISFSRTKQCVSFFHYCRQQANKYGIKGSRVSAARIAFETLLQAEKIHGSITNLFVIQDELKTLCELNEFLNIIEIINQKNQPEFYFEICGKKSSFYASIKSARGLGSV